VPIRLKIAVLSTVGTLVLLAGAGLLFVTTLRSGLENSLDNSLRSRADELTSQLNADVSLRAPASTARLRLAESSYGQLISADDTVLDATSEVPKSPLLTPDQIRQVGTGSRFFDVRVNESGGGHQQLRVLGSALGADGDVVAVSISRDVVDEAVERAGKQLLILGTVVILIAGAGAWLLARGALSPVERMRAQAAELEARDAGGGLSVPTSRDEIGRLASTLNALLARLHAALERERAFVADAGHELRTPLTVLRGELELARRPGRSKADLQQTIEVAAEETERLIQLAEDLLVLARDENAAGNGQEVFDLTHTIRDASSRIESRTAERGVRVELSAPYELLVNGEPGRIRQAIDNVLANAMRFAPADSTISLSAQRKGGWISVEIVDQGPGFPPELLPVVFERFRRADVARSRAGAEDSEHPGAGLGLAIVRSIMYSHGGDATATNIGPGSGARVTLRWPVDSTTGGQAGP
jgi:hypothetical protein